MRTGEGSITRKGTVRGPLTGGRSRVRPAIDAVIAAVFEVGLDDLSASSRGSARAAFARQVAMYLAHVACGLSLTETGALFRRDRTTVAHACNLVEDRRDEPAVDCLLEELERAVRSLLAALGGVRA